MLEHAWTKYLPGDYPPVTIAAVVESANPFIVHVRGKPPLIVMSVGLAGFIFGMVLTAILHAHEEHDAEECLAAMRLFMREWLENDPSLGPSGEAIQRLSTIDQQTTTFAVGLSNCVMTWAFFHELGHFRLGHLNIGVKQLQSTPDGIVMAETRSYPHADELASDRFGLDRYLELLAHEEELRLEFEIGRQGDHAPIIAFELMDLAYKLYPDHDRRKSETHPSPLDRAAALRAHGRFSREGVRFYDYWRDLLKHIESALLAP